MSGWIAVVGLGPGDDDLVTPQVRAALDAATDLVGYIPYIARVQPRPGLVLHPSDNRVELDRAALALDLAAQGCRVALVSSGDPGVFAMASALFETLEAGPDRWRMLDIRILPGITAMLAAAARAGAPLGHDFCAINLSDNLKPWPLIEKRLRLAAEADFAIALYNPRSRARPDGFVRALALLRATCPEDRLALLARAVTTPDEQLHVIPLSAVDPTQVDMRTMVIIGSSQTRLLAHGRGQFLYTPRAIA